VNVEQPDALHSGIAAPFEKKKKKIGWFSEEE
jgi:hypothetical protein